MSAEQVKPAESSAPTVCKGGCGFFGNPRTGGLCSKCAREAEKKPSSPTLSTSMDSSQSSNVESSSSSLSTSASSKANPSIVTSPNINIPTPSLAIPIPNSSIRHSSSVPTNSLSMLSSSPSLYSSSPSISPSPLSSSPSKPRSRCTVCNKKLALDFYQCKCDGDAKFCSSHRLPHAHNCPYDHRKDQQSKIERQNPVVKNKQFESI